jgi:hypothetical protein
LPPWNDTGPKAAIISFVKQVTTNGSPGFVPEAERVAVFDNDGTLWVEHPMYTQLAFALDRVKAAASSHPTEGKEPYLWLRLYGPDEAFWNKSFEMPDVELMQ